MNVFYLNKQEDICAQMHVDSHCSKMIIEYAQLMSTAHRTLDGELYIDKTANGRNIKRWRLVEHEDVIYKASHVNHPSGVWTRASDVNYKCLYSMWLELCKEYTHRYGKIHLTQEKLEHILSKVPENIPEGPLTEVPQAMPEDVKRPNPIDAYKSYYRQYKQAFAKWTNRPTPEFMLCHTH